MGEEKKQPCELHQGLVDKFEKLITGLAALEAGLPGKLDAIAKEFKYVGAEMHRRTEVLFKKYDELDKRVNEHDKCIIHLQNDVENIKKAPKDVEKIEGKLRLLEDWRIKVAAWAACLLFIFQTAVSLYRLFQ